MMKGRSLASAVLALGLAAACAAVMAQQAKAPARVNTEAVIRLASASSPLTTDPHKQTVGGASVFTNIVFDRLTRIDEKAGVLPMLATSWTASADGSALDFKLRRDVKF